MPFSVTCPQCLTEGRAKEEWLGKRIRCSRCGKQILVTKQAGRETSPEGPGRQTRATSLERPLHILPERPSDTSGEGGRERPKASNDLPAQDQPRTTDRSSGSRCPSRERRLGRNRSERKTARVDRRSPSENHRRTRPASRPRRQTVGLRGLGNPGKAQSSGSVYAAPRR